MVRCCRPLAQDFWISQNAHGRRGGPAMKFVVASYGSRGEVEPCAAVGRELLRRGHEVRIAVPPDLVRVVESAGLAAVACGPDSQAPLEAARNLWTCFSPRHFLRVQGLIRAGREFWGV